MPNLPLEITHSLSFLSSTLREAKKICESSSSTVNNIYKMDLKKDGAPGQMRKKASDYRKDTDDTIETILDDYKLFQKDMNDIYKNRTDETVIYSLRQYKEIYEDFKDIEKTYKKQMKKNDIKTSKCSNDKDYVRYLAINKTTLPLNQMTKVIDACIFALENLLDIKKEA